MRAPPKLRRAVITAGRALRAFRDVFPVTLKGALLMGGSALALTTYGIKQIDLLLLVVGGVGLALGGLALLVVAPAALVLFLTNRRPKEGTPLTLTTGMATKTGFTMPSLWYVPLLTIEWTWETPDAEVRTDAEGGRTREWIRPRRRALVDHVVRRFTVRDAWGLAHVSFKRTEPRSVRVVPSVGALRNVPVVRAMSGGDDFYDPLGASQGDRADMRAYGPGDPVRLILWKVYAKTRNLVVRTPEKARSPTHKTVAYVVAGPGDEPAAGAARAAVQNGALGATWRLGADGCEHDATSADAAEELFARSGNGDPARGGEGLTEFLARAAADNGRQGMSRAVLFVPARPGAWVERVVAAARTQKRSPGAPSGVEILVCTDGVVNEAPRTWWARLLTAPPEIDSARAAQRELTKVTDALGAAHVPVSLVDRASGRVFQNAFRRLPAKGDGDVAVAAGLGGGAGKGSGDGHPAGLGGGAGKGSGFGGAAGSGEGRASRTSVNGFTDVRERDSSENKGDPGAGGPGGTVAA